MFLPLALININSNISLPKIFTLMKRENRFYMFLLLFLIIATGLRSVQINLLNFKFGELSPLITTVLFILLIRKDSFKLICFNRFNFKILIIPVLIFLLIISIDFCIQLRLNLIKYPPLNISFLVQLSIFIILFPIGIGGFEEISWRGYLISKIVQNKLSWNSLIIITGTMWSIWHLPTHYLKFENHLYIQYPLFIITCFELSIIMAYLRLKTNSVIPAIIIHSVIAIVYQSFFKASEFHENYYYLTFPSIVLAIMLIPPAFYYYNLGNKIYNEQLLLNFN